MREAPQPKLTKWLTVVQAVGDARCWPWGGGSSARRVCMSERRACRVVAVDRSSMRYRRRRPDVLRILGCRSRCAVGPRCTRRCSNAHRTANPDEREVLYPWHPWGGCLVRVHEAIEKADGIVLRCSRDGATKRWLELPAWMFDRAVCLPMRITRDPWIQFAALASARPQTLSF
jgi:hypothetical protein